ncbi:MAG TPA: hypothetical protein P5121_38755 [Caldilineaceae bacterium]|nr:hypothetical protein [Caldilineaceae bacterium]
MWCHLLLAFPAIGLCLFFLMPFATALVFYLVVVLLVATLYYQLTERMNTDPAMPSRESTKGARDRRQRSQR